MSWVVAMVGTAARGSPAVNPLLDGEVENLASAWLASWSRPTAVGVADAEVRLIEAIAGVPVDAAPDLDAFQPALTTRPWDIANQVTLAFHRTRRSGTERSWWEDLARLLAGFQPHRNPDALQPLGLWGHIAHLEIVFGPAVRLDNGTVDWVLGLQHRDGLCYPAGGGGACPDLNWVNIVLSLHLRGHVDHSEVHHRFDRLLWALRPLFDETLARESLRERPLPIWHRLSLPATAAWWTSPRVFRALMLAEPSWWHTAVRAVTVLTVIAFLNGVQLEPTPHHLLAWLSPSTLNAMLLQ